MAGEDEKPDGEKSQDEGKPQRGRRASRGRRSEDPALPAASRQEPADDEPDPAAPVGGEVRPTDAGNADEPKDASQPSDATLREARQPPAAASGGSSAPASAASADVTLEPQQDAAPEGAELETLDLAQREAAPRSPAIGTGTYNPSHDREQKRGRVALMLLWLLSAIVGGSFLLLLIGLLAIRAGAELAQFQGVVEAMATVLQVLLTPIVGLVGAVTGFYFGEKSAADRGD